MLEETRDTLKSGLCLRKHFPLTTILREYVHSQDHRCENTADAATGPSPIVSLSGAYTLLFTSTVFYQHSCPLFYSQNKCRQRPGSLGLNTTLCSSFLIHFATTLAQWRFIFFFPSRHMMQSLWASTCHQLKTSQPPLKSSSSCFHSPRGPKTAYNNFVNTLKYK